MPEKTVVVFPYRRDSDERERNLRLCLHILSPIRNHFTVVVAEYGESAMNIPGVDHHVIVHGPFSKCRACNAGGRLIASSTAVAFADSDIVLRRAQWLEAVKRSRTTDFVKPFSRWMYVNPLLSQAYADDHHWGKFTADAKRASCIITKKRNLTGGVVFVRRAVLDAIGWWDERFVGHGAEDIAMNVLAERGPFSTHRIRGFAYHLHHPVGYRRGNHRNARLLRQDYRRVSYIEALRRKQMASIGRQG